jgi:transposase-like protein
MEFILFAILVACAVAFILGRSGKRAARNLEQQQRRYHGNYTCPRCGTVDHVAQGKESGFTHYRCFREAPNNACVTDDMVVAA